MSRIVLFFSFILILLSCAATQNSHQSNFIKEDDSVNLYAFVGEKVSIVEIDANEYNKRIEIDSITGDTIIRMTYVMDNAFKAKYKVIKNVFNSVDLDTVEFIVYDHYGRPQFEDLQNVLLYVSLNEERGVYYHQKYQFDAVEKNRHSEWKGEKGQSLQELFLKRKQEVLINRGLFE
ncbi:hypothetical protein J0X14_11710 [Muricauda sp. CAU 1633]|uniref:hypothetical protein n=1 Tax=Allomuricauda sp. CAU 1633 TaxID=2816036 RepID=UPI001A8D13F1|nr:hypothetical protein [Muricauda sp. CAU 1633]MBO0322963.1 hypothetical protein [Muricauda sp. CAU 1633]